MCGCCVVLLYGNMQIHSSTIVIEPCGGMYAVLAPFAPLKERECPVKCVTRQNDAANELPSKAANYAVL